MEISSSCVNTRDFSLGGVKWGKTLHFLVFLENTREFIVVPVCLSYRVFLRNTREFIVLPVCFSYHVFLKPHGNLSLFSCVFLSECFYKSHRNLLCSRALILPSVSKNTRDKFPSVSTNHTGISRYSHVPSLPSVSRNAWEFIIIPVCFNYCVLSIQHTGVTYS